MKTIDWYIKTSLFLIFIRILEGKCLIATVQYVYNKITEEYIFKGLEISVAKKCQNSVCTVNITTTVVTNILKQK